MHLLDREKYFFYLFYLSNSLAILIFCLRALCEEHHSTMSVSLSHSWKKKKNPYQQEKGTFCVSVSLPVE